MRSKPRRRRIASESIENVAGSWICLLNIQFHQLALVLDLLLWTPFLRAFAFRQLLNWRQLRRVLRATKRRRHRCHLVELQLKLVELALTRHLLATCPQGPILGL